MSGTAFNSPQLDMSDSASHQSGVVRHAKQPFLVSFHTPEDELPCFTMRVAQSFIRM